MRRHSSVERFKFFLLLAALCALGLLALGGARSSARNDRQTRADAARAMRDDTGRASSPTPALAPSVSHSAARQSPAQAKPSPAPSPAAATEQPKIEGCVSCHGQTEPMHKTRDGKLKDDGTDRQNLTCTYCHGGNPVARLDDASRARLHRGDAEFDHVMKSAHVAPRYPERWAGREGKY